MVASTSGVRDDPVRAVPDGPAPRSTDGGMVGLPVAVDGPSHVVTQVAGFVEAALGWQVTSGGDLPARVRLVAVESTTSGPDPGAARSVRPGGLPRVLLVGPDDPPVAVARVARSVDEVVAWPAGHGELARAVERVVTSPRADADQSVTSMVRVAGARGGVGTTTVALAIGGWSAWRGGRSLVVVSGDAPVRGVAVVGPEVLSGHRAWAAATDVPGVDGLRVVASSGPVGLVAAPDGVDVVVDDGVVTSDPVPSRSPTGPTVGTRDGAGTGEAMVDRPAPDLLVAQRDRPGCAAARAHPGAMLVVVDRGLRALRRLRTAAGGRPVVVLPWSVRVARAHDRRRVPESLPRAFLDPLRLGPEGRLSAR